MKFLKIYKNQGLERSLLPSYENGFKILDTKEKLTTFIDKSHHIFIPDNISLLQDELINWQHIQGSKQLTDAYLLALAKYNHAVFISLDSRIATHTAVSIGEQDFISLIN
ncbi:hypothetical protein B5J94_04290 [Moraxella lacunata]|uniref:PIN domain-containing protein n=1 Tax=Moraxella lacunata TaxID=477 RepID=A0A1V4H185_MORLA|nr:hypothetical protein [Moraxella lacunata]OPH38146.1 hypothetical protein B5J94_04290 [Moraxella lacunata]